MFFQYWSFKVIEYVFISEFYSDRHSHYKSTKFLLFSTPLFIFHLWFIIAMLIFCIFRLLLFTFNSLILLIPFLEHWFHVCMLLFPQYIKPICFKIILFIWIVDSGRFIKSYSIIPCELSPPWVDWTLKDGFWSFINSAFLLSACDVSFSWIIFA